jgi:hypothetical protein
LAKTLPSDDRNRRIPQSKNEGTFDKDLFETLKKTILQANKTEGRVEDLEDQDLTAEETADFDEALSQLTGRVDSVEDRADQFEEELAGLEEEFETPDLTAADLKVRSLAVGDVERPQKGVVRAEKGAALGQNTTAAQHYLDIWSREANHIRLSGPNAEAELWAQDDTLGFSSKAVELDAESVDPARDYETTLGSPQNKYLSLHAAELWVESLVAQKKTATIGGSVFVGPTTKLTGTVSSDPADSHYRPHKDRYNYIRVEHGQMSKGDVIQLEARGRVEFLRVKADRTEIESPEGEGPLEIGTGVYRYEVERDLDGTGPNTWKEGDAVISTGRESSGFIDLYAQRSQRAENESGPSIAISVREEDKSTYDRGRWSAQAAYASGDTVYWDPRDWSSSRFYREGDLVYYGPEDTFYAAAEKHVPDTADEPLSGSDKWEEAAPIDDDWSANTTYQFGDVVYYAAEDAYYTSCQLKY